MSERRVRNRHRSPTSRYRNLLRKTRSCFLFLWSAMGLRPAATAALEGAGQPTQRPGVQVHLDPCLDVNRSQVEQLLVLELPAQLIPPGPSPPATVQASASCTELGVELRVDDPITGKSLRRTINLTRAPVTSRPRLLALALAELTFTSWTELVIRLRPEAPAPVTEVPPESAEPVPAATLQVTRQAMSEKLRPALPDPRLHTAAVGSAMALFAGTGVLFGGGLNLGYEYAHHLGLSFDVLAHHGSTLSALGSLSTDVISASTTLVFHYRVAQRRTYSFALRAGGGVRGGAVRLSGSPYADSLTEQGATVWGPYAGPHIALGGSLNLPHRLTAELTAEGGYVALPVGGRVDGMRAVAVEGPWLGIHLGLGVGGKT